MRSPLGALHPDPPRAAKTEVTDGLGLSRDPSRLGVHSILRRSRVPSYWLEVGLRSPAQNTGPGTEEMQG